MKLNEVTYPAMVGGFFDFRLTAFFCCFLGLPESGSDAVEAPVAEAAAPARLRNFLSWPAGLAGPDGSG